MLKNIRRLKQMKTKKHQTETNDDEVLSGMGHNPIQLLLGFKRVLLVPRRLFYLYYNYRNIIIE